MWDGTVEGSGLIQRASQEVIANIGQLTEGDKRVLEMGVKAGVIVKWRGKWFPVAGAPFGIGPDKTCYGPKALRDQYVTFEEGGEI